jgi:glycosyltransferase involved in cell wall biosynthesis
MLPTGQTVTMSLVVPVYSGAQYLSHLVEEIDALRKRWEAAGVRILITETLFALDAPVDDSARVLADLATQHPWVRQVELSRNYGQHSATVAGILYSSGDWVVTLDEDLQHRPHQIETLLITACTERADVVYALPQQWVHGGGYRDRLSRLTKFLIARLSGNRFVQIFNSFRLIRGDIARAASSICAQYTYFDVALTWFTQRITRVPLTLTDDRYTTQQHSGYRLSTLIQHAKRLILTSEFRILRLTTALSALAFFASVAYGSWIIWIKFISDQAIEVEGWTSLMMVLLAFGSISLFFLGVIVEFLHTSMLQLQGKPAFFVVNRLSDDLLAGEVEKLKLL